MAAAFYGREKTMIKLHTPTTVAELARRAAERLAADLKALGAAELALSFEIKGDSQTLIQGLAAAGDCGPGDLSFAISENYLRQAQASGAAAAIVPPALAAAGELSKIICPEPRLLFAVILGLASPAPSPEAGEAFFVDRASCQIDETAIVAQGAHIGRGVSIGPQTVIDPQAVLEDGVKVGARCRIHPRAVLRWGTVVGNGCQIHCGAVIGDDGFGYTQLPAPASGRLIHYKNEHRGRVIIEDDVEIGANSTIDRGLVADTLIGRGTKIDNLVQIGHNCQVGRDCVIVAQTGIGGHSRLGAEVFLLGQAGLGPGVNIGSQAIVSAKSALGSGSLPDGRQVWSGIPVRRSEEHYQIMALSGSQLPLLRRFFQALKKSATFEELKTRFWPKDDKSGES